MSAKVLQLASSKGDAIPILERIRKWNHKRNNLTWDIDLETKMLAEEANEFFTSATLVDQIDAYCDFMFVSVGTILKFYGQKEHPHGLSNIWPDFQVLYSWIESTQSQMETILSERLRSVGKQNFMEDNGPEWYRKILAVCLNIVISANETKGDTLVDGKVAKGADFVPPEQEIFDYLKSVLSVSYREPRPQ